MGTTLPTYTKTIDEAFVTTWYDIKPDAVDNILKATPVWAALMDRGCLKPQEGGDTITETIQYDIPQAEAVAKGHVFQANEPETDTMAIWSFRFVGINIVRSAFDDRSNRGKYRINDYIARRLSNARKAFPQKLESAILAAEVTAETGKELQGLRDILPSPANRCSGTYGKIARPSAYVYESDGSAYQTGQSGKGVQIPDVNGTNAWWGPKYLKFNLPYELNLESDMKVLWNSVQNNQVPPDLIITTKQLIEIYEEFATDKRQIVVNEGNAVASLGFTVFKFKGSDMIWSPNMVAGNMLFLTTDSIEVKYDPGMWFDMTEWKPVPNSDGKYAQILAACNVKCKEMRRNGRAYTTDTDA